MTSYLLWFKGFYGYVFLVYVWLYSCSHHIFFAATSQFCLAKLFLIFLSYSVNVFIVWMIQSSFLSCANVNFAQNHTFISLLKYNWKCVSWIQTSWTVDAHSSLCLPYIWSLVLTVLVCIQYLCCLPGYTCSAPSWVCARRPLHPTEPLPQHHLQLQLAAAVGPAGLHLRPLPHTGLVPVSDFWQAGEHAHPVCGGKWSLLVKHLAKTQIGGFNKT